MSYTSWVFKTLKENGGSMVLDDLEAIFLLDHGENESLLTALDLTCDRLVEEGLLVRSQRDGWTWYSVRFFLDPAFDPREVPTAKYYEYEKIRAGRLEGSTISAPPAYDSPLVPFLPELAQGGVPSCVGHAGAYAAQANYLAVTGDRPETTTIVRDQVDPGTGVVYDKLYRTCFSPWWIYCLTRRRGHISGPGSRTDLVPDVLKEIGAVTWDKVLTPKTMDRAPELTDEVIEKFRVKAAGHRIRGYAKITTWDGLLEAISSHGGRGVIMPINLWSDYTSPFPDGTLRYSPNLAVAGAHSLFWPSYQDGKIISRNSWGSFLRDLKITRKYWEKMAGAAFVFLDEDEELIAKALYTLTTITTVLRRKDGTETPLTCSRILVDGDRYQNVGEVKVMLEHGRDYIIQAEAPITARVKTRILKATVSIPSGQEGPMAVKIIFDEGGSKIEDFLTRLGSFFK